MVCRHARGWKRSRSLHRVASRPRCSPRPRSCSVPIWHRPIARHTRWPGGWVAAMTADQFFWVLARVTGLGSYAALAIALVTGIALRTAVFDWLGSNRAVRGLHEYTIVLWVPLAALHVVSLLLGTTARVGGLDVVVPFHSTYGTAAIGV